MLCSYIFLTTKKITILCIIMLGFSTCFKAQSMNSKTLLNNLEPFWVLLENLRTDLEKNTGHQYTSSLEQSYGFIQLDLIDAKQQLFLRVRYQLQHPKKLSLHSVYCRDENKSKQFNNDINRVLGDFEWHSNPDSDFKLTAKQTEYLALADRIAALGNDINATPSHYGSVTITSDFIQLTQINRRNSRSLDHKDSYCMRDLYFVIPLKKNNEAKEKLKIGSYYLGEMEVYFQDVSAKTQRTTGDKIMAQLKEEIKNYKY